MTQLLTPSEAGRVLGITSAAVKTHDHELQPMRTSSGRRVYSSARIELLLGKRHASGKDCRR